MQQDAMPTWTATFDDNAFDSKETPPWVTEPNVRGDDVVPWAVSSNADDVNSFLWPPGRPGEQWGDPGPPAGYRDWPSEELEQDAPPGAAADAPLRPPPGLPSPPGAEGPARAHADFLSGPVDDLDVNHVDLRVPHESDRSDRAARAAAFEAQLGVDTSAGAVSDPDSVENGSPTGLFRRTVTPYPEPPAESSVPTPEFRSGPVGTAESSQHEAGADSFASFASFAAAARADPRSDDGRRSDRPGDNGHGGQPSEVSDLDGEGFDDFSYWRPNLKVPLEPVEG